MPETFLTPAALRDLAEIRAYIYEQSPEAAVHVLRVLEQSVTLVAQRPAIGHRRRDLTNKDVWFYRVFSYYLVYRAAPPPLTIIRVAHASRDVGRLLARSP